MDTEELIPDNEAERLEAVRRYDVLDTPPDGAFDRLTALAAKHFEVPISIVSIVDTDRIWFKSHHGVEAEEIGRDPGLCASAILHPDPWVVENAETDPRTIANPLVAGELGLRFYAGAPLTTRDGFNLGTLCVIDSSPREFSDEDAQTLADMAAVVMDELELRLAARSAVDQHQNLREQAERMARELQQSLLPPELPAIPGAELAALYLPADAAIVGGDFYDVFKVEHGYVLVVGDVSGKGARAAGVTAVARHTIRSAALFGSSPAEILATLNQALFLGQTETEIEHFCTAAVLSVDPDDVPGLSFCLALAGHPPGLVVRGDGSHEEVGASGLAVGWYRDASFHQSSFRIAPGDALVLFTDGITEARAGAGLLGVEGLAARLTGLESPSAADLVGALERLVSEDEVEVRDDVAALVLKALDGG
jgi:sigma-B regulation protein RsbU (phosphoserine phosphatase)